MNVYVVAQLSFVDRAVYDRYQQRFMKVMSRYRGSLLAADERPSVLEGIWHGDKLVLLSFPDVAAFRDWIESAEYQEILEDRKAGATAVVLLVRGRARSETALTPRQEQIRSLLRQGFSNKMIAGTLGISEGTVKNHVTEILRVLNATNRTQAARFSFESE